MLDPKRKDEGEMPSGKSNREITTRGQSTQNVLFGPTQGQGCLLQQDSFRCWVSSSLIHPTLPKQEGATQFRLYIVLDRWMFESKVTEIQKSQSDSQRIVGQ